MPSHLRILGCSGGIGKDLRTTSLLLDDDILIDAGTGVGDLSLDEMAKIDTIFLTHSHLDHIVSVPLLIDSVGARRDKPIRVFGLSTTIEALQQHIFNNVIWPDFSKIPSVDRPFLKLYTLNVGEVIAVDTRQITVLPASHSVAAVGYAITAGQSTVAFSGDSGPCPAFWDAIQTMAGLKHLIVETSFTDKDHVLADLSSHYCPISLSQTFQPIDPAVQLWISHLKPGQAEQIMSELNHSERLAKKAPKPLIAGQVLVF